MHAEEGKAGTSTVFEASNGVQTQRWSFDASGELIGAYASGDVGDCEFWGELCTRTGTPELVCGAGGAGGGGAGGGGGSAEMGGQAGAGLGGASQGGAQ